MERETLVKLLNEDLAAELAAIVTYITYAARVDGPHRPQLASFFSSEVNGEQLHAAYLANKIVTLGGEPTTTPCNVPLPDGNRAMLESVLKMEREAASRYVTRAKQAEEYGDIGLKITLEDFIRDESTHVEETEAILRHWTTD